MVRNDGRVDMIDLINGILGSLVSITAGCFLYRAWEAMLIGVIGALLTCLSMPIFDKWSVDDPVGASAVHGVGGIWGKIFIRFYHLRNLAIDDRYSIFFPLFFVLLFLIIMICGITN